jgi:Na+-transporting methylmalonyl-CoA/oxaloacetate decarboxylase beta subunit
VSSEGGVGGIYVKGFLYIAVLSVIEPAMFKTLGEREERLVGKVIVLGTTDY